MDNYGHAPYYQDQTGWTHDNFYQLNRYLNRLLTFAGKRMDEIKAIDLSRLSEETRVLLYVLVLFQNKQSLLELENLTELNGTQPLKTKLNLMENPRGFHEIYEQFNVGW